MREIKFRVWVESVLPEETGMYEPEFISGFSPTLGIDKVYTKEYKFKPDTCEFTLLQYTGLKDKNNKEIYEGDVVRYYDSTTMWLVSKIVDVGGAFAVATSENPILLYEFHHDYKYAGEPIPELEVIGNIYENPELLK